MHNIIKNLLRFICISSILILLEPRVFAHSADAHITIINNTKQTINIYGHGYRSTSNGPVLKFDKAQHSDVIKIESGACATYRLTPGALCSLAPGQSATFDGSISVDGWPSSNEKNDQPPDGLFRLWGLNGVVLFYMFGNDYYPIAKQQPQLPNVVDPTCSSKHGNPETNTMLMAYAPPANNGQNYPACPNGYTQAGPICMKYTGNDNSCWNTDSNYTVLVQGDTLPSYRNSPT